MAQLQPHARCPCSPAQGLLVPQGSSQHCLMAHREVKQARVQVMFGLESSGVRCKAKGSAPDTAETIASSFSLRAGRIDGGRGNAAPCHPSERGRYAAPLPPPPTDRSHSYLERIEGILHLSHFLFHGTAAALDLLLQGVLAMLDSRQLLHCFCEARLQLRG